MKITIIIIIALALSCNKVSKKCKYDVYQNGIKIDSVLTKEIGTCRRSHGDILQGVYYNYIGEIK